MHKIFEKYVRAYPKSEVARDFNERNGLKITPEEENNFAHRLWKGEIPEALEVADPIERMNLARILFPEIVEYRGKVIIKEYRKTIYNPVTGRYYQIADRSQINAEAGQIRGLWSRDKDRKKGKCRHGRHGHRNSQETDRLTQEIANGGSRAESTRKPGCSCGGTCGSH